LDIKHLLSLFFLQIFFLDIHAQIPQRFNHLTVEDGLSQATILAITQDQSGFMWFGTADGLNRYDGYEFKTFRYKADNPSSISDNEVMALLVDHADNLWVGTAQGVDVFNLGTQLSKHYGQEFLTDVYVTALYQTKDQHIWIGTHRGLFVSVQLTTLMFMFCPVSGQ